MNLGRSLENLQKSATNSNARPSHRDCVFPAPSPIITMGGAGAPAVRGSSPLHQTLSDPVSHCFKPPESCFPLLFLVYLSRSSLRADRELACKPRSHGDEFDEEKVHTGRAEERGIRIRRIVGRQWRIERHDGGRIDQLFAIQCMITRYQAIRVNPQQNYCLRTGVKIIKLWRGYSLIARQ